MPILKYYVETHLGRPFLFRAISGKLYAMPGWTEVPEGTTIDQLVHVKPIWLEEFQAKQAKFIKQFTSSKGDMTYKVHLKDNEYSCTCPGFKFQNRNCKHIKEVTCQVQLNKQSQ